MNNELAVRDAVVGDAPAMCEVLKRSISELCYLDHGNEPTILSQWLRKKTPKLIAEWIEESANSVLVAFEQNTILAVGAVTDEGEITSNYVSPDARFRGVSKALLNALEERAKERGNERCKLTSTETARRFYHEQGYEETGPPDCKYGTSSGYPMSKPLIRV